MKCRMSVVAVRVVTEKDEPEKLCFELYLGKL